MVKEKKNVEEKTQKIENKEREMMIEEIKEIKENIDFLLEEIDMIGYRLNHYELSEEEKKTYVKRLKADTKALSLSNKALKKCVKNLG